MTTIRQIVAVLGTVTILTAAGCGGSGSGGEKTGRISLGVSDDPIRDAEKVCIEFNEIELHGADHSEIISLSPAEKVDLLSVQGMNAAPILVNHELPAGDYQWMRLGVNAVLGTSGGVGDTGGDACDGEASYLIMDGGSMHNLYVPSGAQSGLKLVGGFTVPVNDTANFTAEFDVGKSIAHPHGLDPDVILRPTIRLVNNVEVGHLTGEVAGDLAAAEGCDPWVYLFNDGVMPNPIDQDALEPDPDDPVATAMVNEQDDGGVFSYHYSIGFLLPGDYEAAFTCDAGTMFVPEMGKPVNIVVSEQPAKVDFP